MVVKWWLNEVKKEKINILRTMTCPGGKRPPRPKKQSKILQIVKLIARIQ